VSDEKFFQPVSGIRVVSRFRGPRTLLTEERLNEAKARVEAGESVDAVVNDIAGQLLADEVAGAEPKES
jgi:hypothetical protein